MFLYIRIEKKYKVEWGGGMRRDKFEILDPPSPHKQLEGCQFLEIYQTSDRVIHETWKSTGFKHMEIHCDQNL